jgi:hypothetical protein
MATHTRISAEPEFIVRQDEDFGRWEVNECPPERGTPFTDIVNREMNIPMDNDALARVIRAHEVMHSKVSPGKRWQEWVDRKWATERAMRAVEEVRVNHLCIRVGFDMKKDLITGTDKPGGERVAQLNKWADAVYGAVILAETGGLKEYLSGVRKHRPEWVGPLKAITKKIVFELAKIDQYELASTVEIDGVPAPYGFAHTERLAAWLDGIAQLDPEEAQDESEREEEEKPPISESEIEQSMASHAQEGEAHDNAPYRGAWGKLNPVVANLDKTLPGSIARKKRASAVGRNPRRIHRMLTDPERRIFDIRSRGKGGIILIDASGSMEFSEGDIYDIVAKAPGALVAMYAEDGSGKNGEPNLHVLAKDGKMVSSIPHRMTGNNVDLPALEWAAKKRTSNKTPIIWVTDGGVTAINGEFYDSLAVQCIHYCRKERIMIAHHVGEANRMLAEMKAGRKPKWVWPQILISSYKTMTGMTLPPNGSSN